MASKINTDNPKHHKYVDVNKNERKKEKRRNISNNINFHFINSFIYKYIINSIIDIFSKYRCYKFIDNYKKPYFNTKNCKIIFDDCNHNTYRIIKNGKMIKQYLGKDRHFKFK